MDLPPEGGTARCVSAWDPLLQCWQGGPLLSARTHEVNAVPAGGSAANPALLTRAHLPGGVCGSPGCAQQLGMRKENGSVALQMSNASLGWCSLASWDHIRAPVRPLRGGHAPLPLRGEGRECYKQGTKPSAQSRGSCRGSSGLSALHFNAFCTGSCAVLQLGERLGAGGTERAQGRTQAVV